MAIPIPAPCGEQHCDKHVCELNFVPMGEEWPSMYFHKELKLMLVIYVDDLKMAGPKENLKKGWGDAQN